MAEREAEFTKWMGPLLEALRSLGGRARPRECSLWIAQNQRLPTEVTEAVMKSGSQRFHNQVQWARQYLAWEGYIDASERGIWTLTAKGAKARISPKAAREIFLKWVDIHRQARENRIAKEGVKRGKGAAESSEEIPSEETDEVAEGTNLLEVLQSLPPHGFERICKRILHEYGFESLEVTGKSRDGGIDGKGILRLNAFVTMKIMFQCKRYQGAVGRSQVGDFRNAVLGRAEKGIFLTTGYFTKDAEAEANRDGALPLELVTGEELVELFQKKGLGVIRREVFDIDHSFFDQFREGGPQSLK